MWARRLEDDSRPGRAADITSQEMIDLVEWLVVTIVESKLHKCGYSWVQVRAVKSPTIKSRPGPKWLLYVLKFEVWLAGMRIWNNDGLNADTEAAVLWLPAGKRVTSLLSFVMLICILSLSHVVSWVRCGTWLYRFLIFATFHSLVWGPNRRLLSFILKA